MGIDPRRARELIPFIEYDPDELEGSADRYNSYDADEFVGDVGRDPLGASNAND